MQPGQHQRGSDEGREPHRAILRADVFDTVGKPLPTSFNRGMRLEAIAALLGHRSMEMTLIYARIANRVVADEYAAVSAKIDALYGQASQLPADYETTGMARLRREACARMLGNGLCTRPPE